MDPKRIVPRLHFKWRFFKKSISEPSVGEFALGLLAAGKVVVPNDKVLTNLDPQLHLGA